MLFVTANSNRAQLEQLTRLLVSAFPGSTIYQHTDPARVIHDALNHKADAVFLQAEGSAGNCMDIVQLLHRQKPELPVFILSDSREPEAAFTAAGAGGFLLQPVDTAALKDALLTIK